MYQLKVEFKDYFLLLDNGDLNMSNMASTGLLWTRQWTSGFRTKSDWTTVGFARRTRLQVSQSGSRTYVLDCLMITGGSGSPRPFLLVRSSKGWDVHIEKQTAIDWKSCNMGLQIWTMETKVFRHILQRISLTATYYWCVSCPYFSSNGINF
jgi:hypothetical protein